ncbi:MAG TPA: TAXI family TRAP transporter solute-binding subunit, partial [Candidatus Binatia bacterium]
AIGWRRVRIPARHYPHLEADHDCLDYGGWPLYTRASLPDEDAYKVCAAIAARKDEIFWEDSFTGIGQLGQDTPATPRDVPLHPGAESWYKEHGF